LTQQENGSPVIKGSPIRRSTAISGFGAVHEWSEKTEFFLDEEFRFDLTMKTRVFPLVLYVMIFLALIIKKRSFM
jgi:hypothetical protein